MELRPETITPCNRYHGTFIVGSVLLFAIVLTAQGIGNYLGVMDETRELDRAIQRVMQVWEKYKDQTCQPTMVTMSTASPVITERWDEPCP